MGGFEFVGEGGDGGEDGIQLVLGSDFGSLGTSQFVLAVVQLLLKSESRCQCISTSKQKCRKKDLHRRLFAPKVSSFFQGFILF